MTLRNFSADKNFKKVAIKNATTFDSVRIRFANIEEWPAPVKNSRTVPFVESYFKVLICYPTINFINFFYFFKNGYFLNYFFY